MRGWMGSDQTGRNVNITLGRTLFTDHLRMAFLYICIPANTNTHIPKRQKSKSQFPKLCNNFFFILFQILFSLNLSTFKFLHFFVILSNIIFYAVLFKCLCGNYREKKTKTRKWTRKTSNSTNSF